MNKQELIDKLNKQLTTPSKGTDFDYGHDYGIQRAIYLAEDLDEQQAPINKPEKPVVPKFVADWVDNSREYSFDFGEWFDYENQPSKVYDWLNPENKRQAELNTLALVTLIVNGPNAVEIKQEKLYTVKVLDSTLFKMTSDNHVRYKLIGENAIPLESKIGNYTFEVNLTEKEIKEADERLWQWAKEVE